MKEENRSGSITTRLNGIQRTFEKSILLHRTPFRDDEKQKVEGKEKVLKILQKTYQILQIQLLQEGKLIRHAVVTEKENSRKVTHAHTGIDLNA